MTQGDVLQGGLFVTAEDQENDQEPLHHRLITVPVSGWNFNRLLNGWVLAKDKPICSRNSSASTVWTRTLAQLLIDRRTNDPIARSLYQRRRVS